MKFGAVIEEVDSEFEAQYKIVEDHMILNEFKTSTKGNVRKNMHALWNKYKLRTPTDESFIAFSKASANDVTANSMNQYRFSFNVWRESIGLPELPKPRKGHRGTRKPPKPPITEEEFAKMLRRERCVLSSWRVPPPRLMWSLRLKNRKINLGFFYWVLAVLYPVG